MKIKRRLKNFAKQFFRIIFETGQRFGLDILPRHFYSGLPDFRELRQNDYWRKPHSMVGINGADTESQFAFVEECCNQDLINIQEKTDIYAYACRENGEPGFGRVESNFLFCFIFTQQPKRIIQIGGGLSTAVMLMAAQEAGYVPQIICIELYPNKFLLNCSHLNKIRLIIEKAQKVDLQILTDLGENGLLFVDSTHTVKPGSEVNRLILEVLPRLKEGNWVHFHDIYFPYDYPRDILGNELFFSNETALLHAFLVYNDKYTLRAALGMLHYANPLRLKGFLPRHYCPSEDNYGMQVSQGDFPSSAYLEVVK